jgi:ribosomal protein S18 acetylase RimI-like enzyme
MRIKEQLALALSPGGARASIFWVLKRVAKVEVYYLLGCATAANTSDPTHADPPRDLLRLAELGDVQRLGPSLENELDEHSAIGLRTLIAGRSRMYALLRGGRVAAQLNIGVSGVVRVDSPRALTFRLNAADAFLSYLHTREHCRRMGMGAELVRLACEDLARDGYRRVLCHVSGTNVPSLNTFKRAGWKRLGRFLTTRTGKLLVQRRLSAAGVRIDPA